MVKPDHAFLNHIVALRLATGEICKRVEVCASLSGASLSMTWPWCTAWREGSVCVWNSTGTILLDRYNIIYIIHSGIHSNVWGWSEIPQQAGSDVFILLQRAHGFLYNAQTPVSALITTNPLEIFVCVCISASSKNKSLLLLSRVSTVTLIVPAWAISITRGKADLKNAPSFSCYGFFMIDSLPFVL